MTRLPGKRPFAELSWEENEDKEEEEKVLHVNILLPHLPRRHKEPIGSQCIKS